MQTDFEGWYDQYILCNNPDIPAHLLGTILLHILADDDGKDIKCSGCKDIIRFLAQNGQTHNLDLTAVMNENQNFVEQLTNIMGEINIPHLDPLHS